jgi:hypothetical protein
MILPSIILSVAILILACAAICPVLAAIHRHWPLVTRTNPLIHQSTLLPRDSVLCSPTQACAALCSPKLTSFLCLPRQLLLPTLRNRGHSPLATPYRLLPDPCPLPLSRGRPRVPCRRHGSAPRGRFFRIIPEIDVLTGVSNVSIGVCETSTGPSSSSIGPFAATGHLIYFSEPDSSPRCPSKISWVRRSAL